MTPLPVGWCESCCHLLIVHRIDISGVLFDLCSTCAPDDMAIAS